MFHMNRCSTKSGPGRHGFTLVDLMLVIVVLVLGAAFVMAAVNDSRRQSLASVCQDNLRQLGMAVSMYMDVYDGKIISAEHHNDWNLLLAEHGYAPGSREEGSPVFWCTDFDSERDRNRQSGSMWRYATYTFNFTNLEDEQNTGELVSRRFVWTPPGERQRRDFLIDSNKIGEPGNYWMISEGIYAKCPDHGPRSAYRTHHVEDFLWDAEARRGLGIHLRHPDETVNMVFFDGHVEAANAGRLKKVGPVHFEEGWDAELEKLEF